MATLKAADAFVGGMFGFIGGGLLSGAYMAHNSNKVNLEAANFARTQVQQLDDARRTAEHYKYLYKGAQVCLDHLESENKKLKQTTIDTSWKDIAGAICTTGFGLTVLSAMMK